MLLDHDLMPSSGTARVALPGHEGTFLLSAFWLVDALLWLGREEESRSARRQASRCAAAT
jgi:hypothetical protein